MSLKCPIALFWKCVFSVNLDEPVCLCLFFFHFEGTTRSGCANQTCCNFVFCSQITTFVVLFVCVAKPPSARSDQSPVMPLESRLAALWVSNTQANVIADYLIKNILLLRNFKPFFFSETLQWIQVWKFSSVLLDNMIRSSQVLFRVESFCSWSIAVHINNVMKVCAARLNHILSAPNSTSAVSP